METFVLIFILGMLLGGLLVYLWRNAAIFAAKQELKTAKALYEQRLEDLKITKENIETSFRAAASDALNDTIKIKRTDAEKDLNQIKTETLGKIQAEKTAIENVITGLGNKLDAANTKITTFENERIATYTKLNDQLAALKQQEDGLIQATGHLKSALTTSSSVRGRWGEMVLKNILVASDLVEGVDFFEQSYTRGEEGQLLKPDFIIKLPNCEYQLAIDAKSSLHESYLEGEKATTEEARKACYVDFVKKIRGRVQDLSGKAYEKYVSDAVPYVVMFMPSEAAIRAAFDTDPDLFRWAASKRVVITSPATIIPLILVIASAWKQFKLSTDAKELSNVVKELGERLKTFVSRLSHLQKGIEDTANAWNEAIGKSWQGNKSVVKSLDKVKQLGNLLPDIPELSSINPQLTPILTSQDTTTQ